jgi:outer membrane protein W
MIRSASAFALALGFLSLASGASAQAPAAKPGGFSLGLRTGFALPMGRVGYIAIDNVADTRSRPLSDKIMGMVPIWLDAGYRINPSVYVGAFFQYSFAFINNDKTPSCDQLSCSAHDISFGANVHYHLHPGASFDPWIGAGVGYEMTSMHQSGTVTLPTPTGPLSVSTDTTSTIKGFQFLMLQAGGDFRATPDLAVGPFVNFALGQYSTYTLSSGGADSSGDLNGSGMHEWLTIGARGQFEL